MGKKGKVGEEREMKDFLLSGMTAHLIGRRRRRAQEDGKVSEQRIPFIRDLSQSLMLWL